MRKTLVRRRPQIEALQTRPCGQLLAGLFLALIPSFCLAADFSPPPIEDFLMDTDREIALARSAAPPKISADATVLVLERDGYHTSIVGTNGFVCLVLRSWGNPVWSVDYEYSPGIIVPECLGVRAQETILPMQLYRAKLGTQALPPEEIRRRIMTGFATSRFKRTKTVSFSYMMSSAMTLSDGSPIKPHVMVYLPDDFHNDSVGGFSYREGFVIVEGGPDQPFVAANIYRPELAIDPVWPNCEVKALKP